MKREEIIDFCDMKSQLEPENEDIFNYIVKIVEQEPILDMIRAEIESLKRFEIMGEKTPLINVDNALNIIDKYKAESEDKE